MSDPAPGPLLSRRLLPLGCIACAAAVFLVAGGHHYLSFETLAGNREWLCALARNGGILAAVGFILVYAGLVTISLPGASIFTVTSGFLFGPWLGTVYALVAATIGACGVFLAARAGLAGLVAKAGPRVRRLEAGFRDNALSYLLAVRLVPVFPFWLVNIVAGATGMKLSSYAVATFVGMIPATFIFASLGNGIGDVLEEGSHPDFEVLFRPSMLLPIIGLALLALAPAGYRVWRRRTR